MAEQRLAIVTGGSRGIGKAIVFALAKSGYKVAALATNQVRLDALQVEAKEAGYDILVEAIDITDSDGFEAVIIKLADDHGGVGVLVNNAGITRDGLVITISNEDFDAVIATNLKAAFVAMRTAGKTMMRNRFGRVINISSVSGILGSAGQGNYAASKAGLIAITKSMARELAPRGVTANCIAPGFIETDMTDVLNDKVKDGAKAVIPLRKFGQASDIANAVVFLASEEAGYITGQVLAVDGGMAM
jgi:3-oxoacyl-[acyl-carrier protein] reductase